VEAARAGEAGAGFAVVADEVRALAQRAAQAARETAEKIDDSIAKSGHGVNISAKVAEGLKLITDKTLMVNALVVEIATASKEQTEGLSQIGTAVSQMDQVTQSNAGNAEETAAAAEELNAQATMLRETVAELLQLVGGGSGGDSPTAQVGHVNAKAVKPKKSTV
ncbi:MAG TPA: methyl-accepting chemotaxis protein, partial [Rariglobus sp.]